MSKARGLFRNVIEGVEYARVEYNPYDIADVPRLDYEKLGFEPIFDELPTFAEFEARDDVNSARLPGSPD
ncbi:hypothetical protein LMIY3S_01672 [Labrys miyagiensis]